MDAIDIELKPARQVALLPRHQVLGLVLLGVMAVILGGITEIRGALIHNRHTDVDVYFSAAYAVRVGGNLYDAVDTNGWHYVYPPLLAVLMSPFADAAAGVRRYLLLPYAVSVAGWYILSILFLVVAVDQLTRALLKTLRAKSKSRLVDAAPGTVADNPARWAWRWWTLWFWPLLLCAPAIVRSVIRGQVGPLWLLLICLMFGGVIDARHFRAGMWLAAAICLKVIPVFLLIYPLWRRNGRMLAGCIAGLVLGLGIIPWLGMGTHDYLLANREYLHRFILPVLNGAHIDGSVQNELTNPDTSDTQSLVTVLMHLGHNFLGTEQSYNPPLFARVGEKLIGGAMVLATLLAAGFKRPRRPLDEALFLSLLSVVLLPISPVCHPHYFMLMIPLIAVILAMYLGPGGYRKVGPGMVVLLLLVPLSHLISGAGVQVFRDAGTEMWVCIAVWAAGVRLLWHKRPHPTRNPTPARSFSYGLTPVR